MMDLQAEITRHLRVLCDEIGPRPGGSPGDYAAQEYIVGEFARAGWPVERQEFPCPSWEHRRTALTLNGETLTAAANAYSPPCDVNADIVVAGTLAELEAAEMTGRIVVLYGTLTDSVWSPKSWFLLTEREAKIIALLEEKRPAALITVQPHFHGLERIIEDWEFRIPSATVSPEAGLALLRQPDGVVSLTIDTAETPGSSANILAHRADKYRTEQNRVVIMAHFDTKIDTPGAFDNGGGVAALLALADYLQPEKYPFELHLLAMTNEEYLPIGDDEYVRRYGGEFDQIITAINIDAVGHYLVPNSIAIFESSPQFQTSVEQAVAGNAALQWVDPWPQSNHSTFSMRGVPALAFGATLWSNFEHHQSDTVDWMNPAQVADVVIAIGKILDSLDGRSPTWTRSEQ